MNRLDRIRKRISFLYTEKKEEELIRLLSRAHPEDLPLLIEEIEIKARVRLLESLKPKSIGITLRESEPAARTELLKRLNQETLARALDSLPPDEGADIIGELDHREADELLSLIERERSQEIRGLLRFPEDTAGGRMTPEVVSIKEEATVQEAIDELRKLGPEIEEAIFSLYVIDRNGQLIGLVPLQRLITAAPDVLIKDVLSRNINYVYIDTDQEELARVVKEHNLSAIPVVDKKERLVGRVTADDVMDILEEETTEDIYKMAATDDDELATRSALKTAGIRLPWLIVCIIGSVFVSGAVISFFEGTLMQVIALASFIPVITATGGNTGLQSSTIIIRRLALNSAAGIPKINIFLKEIRTAAILGVVCGGLVFLMALVWKQEPLLGFIVGVSLFLAVAIASLSGMMIPLIFKRVGIDPAVASGPFITTLNDVIGLTIYLGLASLLLKALLL